MRRLFGGGIPARRDDAPHLKGLSEPGRHGRSPPANQPPRLELRPGGQSIGLEVGRIVPMRRNSSPSPEGRLVPMPKFFPRPKGGAFRPEQVSYFPNTEGRKEAVEHLLVVDAAGASPNASRAPRRSLASSSACGSDRA